MILSPILHPRAPGASANSSSATATPACNGRPLHERKGVRPALSAFLVATALGGCAGSDSVAVSDTYCRDTFYWRTSARDTEETRRQADRHNSRRLCRCANDCT